MSVSELSASTQNYLKVIWSLTEWSDAPVTAKSIAVKSGLKLSSVSDAIRRLSTQGLLTHAPYGAVELTEAGRAGALAMVRRHRLIETFLVETLGYRWDQIHDEAENLEHAVSDFMVERIDELLGSPQRDPHGDPIPARDGAVTRPDAVLLTQIEPGSQVLVERISDADPQLLQFFRERGVVPGVCLEVGEGQPYSGAIALTPVTEASAAVAAGADAAVAPEAAGPESAAPVELGRAAAEAVYVSLQS
ncbi:metal-dependent transcriptional regulator [Brevibacterium sp. 91QC2O2]|uniref:metal-dependent transcriptional regulator n=1 Tax=Brevibacterium sp. 91QC2O2 TaxID=2968458 RepID=UPI00211D1519|nr:metal-dependent transcriptional regulator [Brevibacterium sp. 91QC2O2]MCQ9369261.1 metal-dependent transcriptional regulator [Brevibacterium sp. 91QC2O2]